MRPFGAWSGRLALAGACLLGSGCGGGEAIPDPDSDTRAAEAPRRAPGPRDKEVASEPTALATNAPVPDPEKASPPIRSEERPKAEEKPAEPEKPASGSKGDASGTDDMLRMSNAPGATPPAGGSPPPAAAPTPNAPPSGPTPGLGKPAGPGGGGGSAPTPPSFSAPMPNSGNGPGGGAGAPGGDRNDRGSTPPGNAPAGGDPNQRKGGGGPSALGGGMALGADAPSGGGPGALSPGGTASGPGAFRRPDTAVQAFLAALKAKDKDRLTQCTALHAPTESDEKHHKIFAAIIEGSISDEELDDMAKALDGYQVSGLLEAKSTGRLGVTISKMDGRDRLQRTIMTRKEKEGWKVLDVDKATEFKYIKMPTRGGRKR